MVSIRLPDGSVRQYDHPVTVAEVAASIGAGLAKAALGGRLDGELVDTSTLIDHDASLAIVTEKDADGLDIVRHSAAHLLAYAVKDLYPEAQVTIGPVIDNGFYYDFAYSRPFTPEDLEKIEKRMQELAKKDEPVSRRVVSRMKPSTTSRASARSTRRRSSNRSRPPTRSSFIHTAGSPICAAARTCRPPASSRSSS